MMETDFSVFLEIRKGNAAQGPSLGMAGRETAEQALTARIVSHGRIRWADSGVNAYKSTRRDPKVIMISMMKVFTACIALGYIRLSWTTIRDVFNLNLCILTMPKLNAFVPSASWIRLKATSLLGMCIRLRASLIASEWAAVGPRHILMHSCHFKLTDPSPEAASLAASD
jgi:hypothetical protein